LTRWVSFARGRASFQRRRALSNRGSRRLANRLHGLKKHGFKNFAEYEVVAANIFVVMAAIDPRTRVFADPQAAIKKELEEVSANKIIAVSEKKKSLGELNEALKSAESIQFPTNIELVMKYYDKIDATTIHDPDTSNFEHRANNQRIIKYRPRGGGTGLRRCFSADQVRCQLPIP
jgi:hypothetical protein